MAEALAPCPYCQETIQPLATKCRYCKELLPDGWSARSDTVSPVSRATNTTGTGDPAQSAAARVPVPEPAVVGAAGCATVAGVLALIVAILAAVIPVFGVLYFSPLAVILGIVAMSGGARGFGIAVIVIVSVNMVISPTFWLNIGAGSNIPGAGANRMVTYVNVFGVLGMILFLFRGPRRRADRPLPVAAPRTTPPPPPITQTPPVAEPNPVRAHGTDGPSRVAALSPQPSLAADSPVSPLPGQAPTPIGSHSKRVWIIGLAMALLVAAAGYWWVKRPTGGLAPLGQGAAAGEPTQVGAAPATGALSTGIQNTSGDETAMSALDSAAEAGDIARVQRLIRDGANVHYRPGFKGSRGPLIEAASRGHLAVVRALVAAGADLDGYPDEEDGGMTALGMAAYNGQIDVVRYLLSAGARLTGGGVHAPVPPLHPAAAIGNEAIVNMLLEAGADPAEIQRGQTASDVARAAGHMSIVSILAARLAGTAAASPGSTAPVGAQRIEIAQLFPAQPTGFVTDVANIIDPGTRDRIAARLRRLQDVTGGDIAVVTLRTIDDRTPSEVAMAIGRTWGVGGKFPIGDKRRDAGVVLLIVPRTETRQGEIRIETGTGAERFISNALAGAIIDSIRPALESGRYGTAIDVGSRLLAGQFERALGVR